MTEQGGIHREKLRTIIFRLVDEGKIERRIIPLWAQHTPSCFGVTEEWMTETFDEAEAAKVAKTTRLPPNADQCFVEGK